jgi:FAD/FMN-containing dehydrogenase
MTEEWENWSGSLRFKPGTIAHPASEEAVRQLVLLALEEGKTIRPVGAGHSSVPLVETSQILLSLDSLKGIVKHDEKTNRVRVLPGTHIAEVGQGLIRLKLSMLNTGDVDFQTLAGGLGTGTHGSGKTLQNLSGMLVGCRVVNGLGDVKAYTLEEHPDMIQAMRVSLGALGVLTELTIQAGPAEKFVRGEYCTHIDACLEHLEELIDNNRMFDFYWYPRSDLAKLRTCNVEGDGMLEMPYAQQIEEDRGWLYQVLPKQRTLKFDEMEYALPFKAGPECFREVRKRVKQLHRHYVGWRVFCRTVAADDAFLSPFYRRESFTIAILQNNQLEYKKYFKDIEPIFRDFGGRPHWGKKHYLKAEELRPLYPGWDNFMAIRRQADPEGIFLNDYLKELFVL